MTDSRLPSWWKLLMGQYRQGVGRVFVLHDNVNDVVYYPSDTGDLFRMRPRTFRDMLVYLLAMEGQAANHEGVLEEGTPFVPVFYASPTIPLTLYYLAYNETLKSNTLEHVYVDWKKLQKEMDRLQKVSLDDRSAFINDFPNKIRATSRDLQKAMIDLLFEMEPYLENYDNDWLHTILILDFFEKITTQQERSAHYKAEEIVRRWALSDRLKRSKNMVIGLTVDLDALPELLRKSDSQIQKIQIPMPSPDERLEFLSYWRKPIGYDDALAMEIADLSNENPEDSKEENGTNTEIQGKRLQELAGLTKGFRLLNLEAMVRMSKAKDPAGKIDQELLKRHKAQLVNEESFGLLEEIQSKRGFEAIGGLDYAQKYFKNMAKTISKAQVDENYVRSVPKGILLCGPPGTGKTILAEALAARGKMTLVKLGDIRGSHVGESEHNMTRVLKLLDELSPVIVFVDEIDQSIGSRGTGSEGDSGVNRRIFGKLLAFMGDNKNRGKVLWIGASNRPDLLDDAMISRFDTVMAILPPYAIKERIRILEVMEKNVEGITFSDEIKDNLQVIAEKLEDISGRAIETIIRKAAGLAKTTMLEQKDIETAISLYKSNANIREVDAQTVNALMATNFTDMLPDDLELYPQLLRSFVKEAISAEKKSNLPLRECLRLIENGELYEKNGPEK